MTEPRAELVVIPCSATKLDRTAPAEDLYIGPYHRMCRRAAESLGGRLVILSARHGLLTPQTVLDPYNHRYGQQDSISPELLRG